MLAARCARRALLALGRGVRSTTSSEVASDRCGAGRPARSRSSVISPNSCTFWKVRATPFSAMTGGFRPPIDWPSNRIAAVGRRIDAGQHVHHRALAGAVRPDQPVDAAARDRQIDLVERLQAAEAASAPGRPPGCRAVPHGAARRAAPDVARSPAAGDRSRRRACGASAGSRPPDSRRCRPAGKHDEQDHHAEDRQPEIGDAGQQQAGHEEGDAQCRPERRCRAAPRSCARAPPPPPTSAATRDAAGEQAEQRDIGQQVRQEDDDHRADDRPQARLASADRDAPAGTGSSARTNRCSARYIPRNRKRARPRGRRGRRRS